MGKTTKASDPRAIRRLLGLSQSEFWGAIGVTQSGGSRYESRTSMPKPVRELVRLVYVEGIDISAIHGDEVAIIDFLKTEDPAMWACFQKAARAASKARA